MKHLILTNIWNDFMFHTCVYNFVVFIMYRWLKYAMDPSIVRKQDADRVFINVGYNVVGRFVAWDFFRSNWDIIFKK